MDGRESSTEASIDDFSKLNIRTGTVISAERFEAARKPSYILQIDFGPLGLRKTSAQITALYTPEELIGKQVVAVINFPARQIANIMSTCLVLGAVDGNEVTLLQPEQRVANGLKIS